MRHLSGEAGEARECRGAAHPLSFFPLLLTKTTIGEAGEANNPNPICICVRVRGRAIYTHTHLYFYILPTLLTLIGVLALYYWPMLRVGEYLPLTLAYPACPGV